MKVSNKYLFLLFVGCASFSYLVLQSHEHVKKNSSFPRVLGALGALEFWTAQRAFPNDDIPQDKFIAAFNEYQRLSKSQSPFSKSMLDIWRPIGPTNQGGRTLAIAINPLNPRIMFAGAASGGLWKSTTGGEGSNSWKYIDTGFPSLSVNTIAIDTKNPDEIFIGTGEVYQYQNSIGGHYIRTTRGSYGIGILHSTDAGTTWTKSLDWTLQQQRGVQQIIFNQLNSKTLYAATSEGTYKSVDDGASWSLIHSMKMANTVVLLPEDTNVVFIACGNLNSTPGPGLYRSTNAGQSFVRLSAGLPSLWSGRSSLAVSPSEQNTIYAGISNDFSTIGLFKSTDRGSTWAALADSDYCTYQGWYCNVLAVHPKIPLFIYAAGVDLWQSNDNGVSLDDMSGNYHVDFHCATFHPIHPDTLFFGTDGGIYRTTVSGGSFRSLNGGYQSTQFYAGFANAADDSNRAMGGLQDNGTVKYSGTTIWQSIFGGDGCWCAFDPRNSDTMYVEYQYLMMARSLNGGQNWSSIRNGISNNDPTCFVGPYVVAPSSPNTLFCGTHKIYKSTDMGGSWKSLNNDVPLSNNPIITIACSKHSIDTLYAATVPTSNIRSGVFVTIDGGKKWEAHPWDITNRYIMDVAIHPTRSNIAYIAVSGFGTEHLYKTTDAGDTWTKSGKGLPDVPTQAVLVDPVNPQIIYLGNDLGVYVSGDEGAMWNLFSDGLPPCTIADITYSPVNKMLRIATHGNGVWQRPPLSSIVNVEEMQSPETFSLSPIYPNPLFNAQKQKIEINYSLSSSQSIRLTLHDGTGKIVKTIVDDRKETGTHHESFSMNELPSGIYFVRLSTHVGIQTQKFVWMK